MPTQPEEHHRATATHPKTGPKRLAPSRRKSRRKGAMLPYILTASAVIFLLALVVLLLTRRGGEPPAAVLPSPSPTVTVPAVTPTPPPISTPTPPLLPTPEPIPSHDFALPAPQREAVEDDYFTDAVFIGDSRTEGLKLFGGIPETDYLQYTGITVFEVGDPRKGVRIDGEKYSILEALGLKQYQKVYVGLGVNELGYFDDQGFEDEYAGFVDKIKALQPDAIIYLQNLPGINPDKAKANSQPYYITNEQIDIYNEIIARIATDKQVVLLDLDTALTDENGILARENSTDGIHFSRDHYKAWYAYLKTHTVDEEQYRAGQ